MNYAAELDGVINFMPETGSFVHIDVIPAQIGGVIVTGDLKLWKELSTWRD